jgi:hypothetical protein
LPVAFKYRQWITPAQQIFFKAGLTAYSSVDQQLQYTYQNNNSPGQDLIQVTALNHNDKARYFGTTAGVSVGVISKTKNPNNRVELSLFYEKSLGTVAQERLDLQLAGIRAAYWFKVK